MTEVRFHFVKADGEPVGNTTFEVTLPKAAFNNDASEYVLSGRVKGETDAEGRASLELRPLSRYPYTVIIRDWKSGSTLKKAFLVPESVDPVHLVDLVSEVEDSDYDFKQETIDMINSARSAARVNKEDSLAASQAASQSAAAASNARVLAEQASTQASQRASEASGYATEGRGIRNQILIIKDEVDGLATQVRSDRNSVTDLKNAVDRRIGDIDVLVQQDINPKIETINNQLEVISQNRIYIDGKVDSISALIESAEFDLTWIASQRNYIDDRVTHFEDSVAELSSKIGSVDAEVAYIQGQRAYFDGTFKPEMESIRDEVANTVTDVGMIKDDIFLLSTNGGAIFTKKWPSVTTQTDRNIDVSQESTHFITLGAGGDLRLTFSGWHPESTKYIVLVITNGGRGAIRWPSTVLWQTRGGAAPILKESGIDTVVMWCSPANAFSGGGPIIFAARVGR